MDKKTKKELKREKFLKKKAKGSNSSSKVSTTKSPSSPSYDPKEIEEKWFKAWERDGLFKPRPGGEKFTITMPPPNITGCLHIGHSMMIAIQDCLVRYKRMKGYEVFYLPGTDHAGIATQSVVSRKYKCTTREEFLKAAWDWKEKYGGRIVEQFKRLGASADFTRTRFTMDPEMSEAVEEAFVRLYEKGLIYRESKIVNWCGRLKTTLSDLEVDHQVVKANTFLTVDEGRYEFGVIYEMRYPLTKGEKEDDHHVLVWTTRPETILGDVALCAHPEDTRYKGLPPPINPLTGEELVFIYDSQACREFGTGLLKITPAHDPVDFEIAKRHGLKGVPIFDSDNRVNVPGCLYGLKRYEARKKALDILREKGLLVRKIPYDQTIPICSRSGDVIEPCIKEQWWLKCQGMAKKALEAVRRREIEIYPPEAEKVWERWLENIRDWCLSRQLWWGHRIPAYTKNGKEWVIKGRKECDSDRKVDRKECESDPNDHHPNDHPNYTQDEDVLDTWFSSSLWPFATMGWPSSPTTPTSLLETGSDILFFWVARMVMMSLELTGDIPFRKILLHGLVRDAHGRKMSKSLGNVIDPLYVIEGIDLDSLISNMKGGNLAPSEVKMAEKTLRKDFPQGIPKCGADALRFTLLSYTLGMKDINLDILRVEGYRRLCNKLWNAHKYVMMKNCKKGMDNGEEDGIKDLESLSISSSSTTPLPVKWLLSRRDRTVEASESALDKFNFMAATQVIHQFFLYDFCDVYIEITKDTKAPPSTPGPS